MIVLGKAWERYLYKVRRHKIDRLKEAINEYANCVEDVFGEPNTIYWDNGQIVTFTLDNERTVIPLSEMFGR